VMGGADNHRRLDGVRESGAFRSDLKRIDLARFMPTVALVQCEVRR
jgi:hypothetical protein